MEETEMIIFHLTIHKVIGTAEYKRRSLFSNLKTYNCQKLSKN